MEIRIEYIEEEACGRINSTSEFNTVAWNRIRDLVIGIQPDAQIIGNIISADWTTILEVAPHLADLRKEYNFKTTYNDQAKFLLTKYREEVLAVRGSAGTFKKYTIETEIPILLKEKLFTQRELKPFQLHDVCKMVNLANGANFSVPGAGKTTVAFAAHVLIRDEDTRLLIIAPKNAFSAWDDVIKDCMEPSILDQWRFTRLIGGQEQIALILRNPPMRLIISYDQLTRVKDNIASLLTRFKVHVILDESHRMKAGDRSQRGSVLLRLAHLPVRRDILSGTPIPRSIEDIGPQLDFLWPGQSIGWRAIEATNPHEVLRELYVRTTKHQLELLPIEREFISIEMSPGQIALYALIRQEVLKQLSGIRSNGNIDLMTAKKSVMRLLQVSSNPILVVKRLTAEQPENYRYDDPKIEAIFKKIVEEYDSPKIIAACELARDLATRGEKTVIWTSFTENVERIAFLLQDMGATYIHGGIDTGDESDPNTREGRIKLFHKENGECKVLVANPAACSEGISLHKTCHHAIYVDRTYNAAHYLQSVDRIHRLGLSPNIKTYVHVLESIAPNSIGAIDFSVRRRLITKLRVMSEALDDADLQRLALDEEEADAPIDYDISLEDLADIIDELVGEALPPGRDEDL